MSGKKKKENKTNPECLLTQASIIPYPLHAYIRIAKTTKIYTIKTPYLSISEKLTRVYNQLIIQCNKKKRKENKIKENYDLWLTKRIQELKYYSIKKKELNFYFAWRIWQTTLLSCYKSAQWFIFHFFFYFLNKTNATGNPLAIAWQN